MRGPRVRPLGAATRSTRLEVALPLVAAGVITLVLLLLVGLHHGLDRRADRTAWRTPQPAAGDGTAIQAGSVDYVGERPITVVETAALSPDPPHLPGMGAFPEPGEVWMSPALAELVDTMPPDELADRFPGPPDDELVMSLLESPDELVVVLGRAASDPSMSEPRSEHQWYAAASQPPVEIDEWSTEPDLYQTTYRDIALLVTVLTVLPLAGLGGLASRLMAGRRRRRIATLRLLGATTAQVVRLSVGEVATWAAAGAVLGAVTHRLLLPLIVEVPIKGSTWYPSDVQPGAVPTVGTVLAVVLALTVGALSGLVPAVRDPLGSHRRSNLEAASVRGWSVLLIGAAVVFFWLRSSNPFVTIAFTAVVLLGWGLISTGPWLMSVVGRLLARAARRPATFLAGRRLSEDPRGAWRTVGGITLAAFVAGFVAAGLPVGLGNAGAYAARADDLDAVVPAGAIDARAREARAILNGHAIAATVETAAPPGWLDEGDWGTLRVSTDRAGDRDRARTALVTSSIWGPELRLSDDLPVVWLLRDGVVISLLVLPIAALVALASMTVGAVARIYEQRESLVVLHLTGTPRGTLLAAQRTEVVAPILLLGASAAAAGLLSGSSLGATSLLNPATGGIFIGLTALGAVALLLVEVVTQPVLARVSTDLSERE